MHVRVCLCVCVCVCLFTSACSCCTTHHLDLHHVYVTDSAASRDRNYSVESESTFDPPDPPPLPHFSPRTYIRSEDPNKDYTNADGTIVTETDDTLSELPSSELVKRVDSEWDQRERIVIDKLRQLIASPYLPDANRRLLHYLIEFLGM